MKKHKLKKRIGMLAVVSVIALAAMSGSVAADSSVDQSSVAIDGNLTVTVDSTDTSLSSGDDFNVVVDDGSQIIGGSTSTLSFDGAGSYTANIDGIDASYVGSEQTVAVRNIMTGSQDPIGSVNLTRANSPDISVDADDAVVDSAPAPFGGESGNVTVDLSNTVLDDSDVEISIDGVVYSDVSQSADEYLVSLDPEDIGSSAGDSVEFTATNTRDSEIIKTGSLSLTDPDIRSTGEIPELNGHQEINVSVSVDELNSNDTGITYFSPPGATVDVWIVDDGSSDRFGSQQFNSSKTNETTIPIQDPNSETASLTVPDAVSKISVDGETVYQRQDVLGGGGGSGGGSAPIMLIVAVIGGLLIIASRD